jgi:hypothetical protein
MSDYHDHRRRRLAGLDRDQLIGMLEDAARNWIAHDGLWFLAAEAEHGLDDAIELDRRAWERFTVIEARRIMKRHGIVEGSGLEGLEQALGWRMYAHLNEQDVVERTQHSLVFRMTACRVQHARERDGRPPFPCKPVGLAEFSGFARTIDPRIETECVGCPPDPAQPGFVCAWRFRLGSRCVGSQEQAS